MGRLAAGVKPTPHLERLKAYRTNLVLVGGKRVLVDIGPEAAQALQAIMGAGDLSIKDAVTAALIHYAKTSAKRAAKKT